MKALIVAVATLMSLPSALAQVKPSVQGLFEAGQYDQALQAIADQREAGAADGYLAAQIFLKRGQPDDAKRELSRLTDQNDRVWSAIAESAHAMIDDDGQGALKAAERAAAMDSNHFFALYQLGLVKAVREDWPGAAEAFERGSQIEPSFAYAHYYAGLAYSKIKRADRTAAHFEMFLKLAPKAPERPAVESIMRTLRGR
jgi:tetratricopeptide (TPR) repeat protein